MRNLWKICLVSALVSSSLPGLAQAPAAAPAAPAAKTAPMPAKPAAEPAAKAAPAPAAAKADMQTFVCKDGSTMSAASSKGACSGRKGIDQEATAKAAAGAKPAATAAPGGGAGKVWANEDSKIYHCPGTRFYGTTKNGKYMSEADAKAAGMHGANNKTCS
ncbi:hypothetical protein DJFAAGMI_03330 [Comamonas sp. PE63]|uniref:DUF3761 domain-containing protein n=2 Tax=Comamonas TaxID=283 RepID=A0ABS5LVN4_9BURK|nr:MULTISPECIES: hypothetical protein [unclassified Comamonas]MBS3020568.1 hypothetical protein [Comamonas sp. PE63]